jgi:2-polyprenyl-3-methyl-5-hydroxy-6-metoxy-1,4-benzoquinol methylase
MGRWYTSLENGSPDFGVYDGDDYMADLWDCWKTYSRKYLRSLRAPGVMPNGATFVDSFNPARIADLGCGIGYSTAALCQLFPNAEVIGTNLAGTKQMKMLQRNASQYSFRVETSLERVGPVDLVFASEYFEHFPQPVSHLDDVVRYLKPGMMLIANTFTSSSIGHFPSYSISGDTFSGRATSRMFSAGLRAHGMTRVPLKVWNGRPSLWARGVSIDDA